MMTEKNFSSKKEMPEIIPAAFLHLKRNPPTMTAPNDVLNIHPETMKYIKEAADITGSPLIDFVFDFAWIRARKIIDKID